MVVKSLVLLCSLALLFFIILLVRKSPKKAANTEKTTFRDSLDFLQLAELEKKAANLEQTKETLKLGFLDLNRNRQERILDQVGQINKHLAVLEEVIDDRRY